MYEPYLRLYLGMIYLETITWWKSVFAFSSSVPKMLIGHRGSLITPGTLKRLFSFPRASIAAISSAESSTSVKFSTIREAVTDLGMTLWPPTWAQARLDEL
jgi:hypothetical protein